MTLPHTLGPAPTAILPTTSCNPATNGVVSIIGTINASEFHSPTRQVQLAPLDVKLEVHVSGEPSAAELPRGH